MINIRLGEREVIETQDVTITLSFKNGEPLNEFTKLIQDEIDKQDLEAHEESLKDRENEEDEVTTLEESSIIQ